MTPRKNNMQWFRMDLHLHTPASDDYQQPDASYLDILRKAEFRGLDIIAFTDHNTVRGYANMLREVEQLLYLERLGRLEADEARQLAEYQRLSDALMVLPGFEFTATFGFHVLGVFAPGTTVSYLEHLLLSLNVPSGALAKGSSVVGASAEVLTAYRTIHEAGGICIAAHVNSAHGVAMRGQEFGALGGQTRIAYTQDHHPARAGSHRYGAARPTEHAALLRWHQARIPAPHAHHPGLGRAPHQRRGERQQARQPRRRRPRDGSGATRAQLRGAAGALQQQRLHPFAPLPG